ncbi:MAG: hypothetical protein CTY35_00510 [Methylotenera sp.]|uniref:ArdC family protein n=1 Tax=Methylotenera sp. TaxID=2051956 RepID=UPI000D4D1BA2|nr:ArdC family protein [Methylotenera sp.]PPC84837.1 MAG: hypothetical protein CTY38_00505 [Methylotenera sp.]PPD02197.1 MAG: hypothetical protein CTY35_00510 [Methylotenera sp.]
MSKINELNAKGHDVKIDTLAAFADSIINRVARDEMPWQVGQTVNRMPVTLSGKPISNVNFLSLVGAGEDHRWGRFDEFKSLGAFVKRDMKSTLGVFWRKMKPTSTQAISAEDELDTAKPSVAIEPVKSIRRLMSVRYFNMAQTDIESADAPEIDFSESMMHLEDIALNAGVTLVKKSQNIPDTLTYEGNIIYADADKITQESVGLAVVGFVDWVMDDSKPFNTISTDEVRSQLVRAVAVSMLCAEYGVPVPDKIQIEMAAYKPMFVDMMKSQKDQVFKVAKDAWEIRQFIQQFSPSLESSATADQDSAGDGVSSSVPNRQPNSLYGG